MVRRLLICVKMWNCVGFDALKPLGSDWYKISVLS